MGKQGKIKAKLGKIGRIVIPFVGPIMFEIANSITGDWVDKNNKVNITTGKTITIIIALIYVGALIYYLIKDRVEEKSKEYLENQLEEAYKVNISYSDSMESIGALLAYTEDNVKEQINYLKMHNKIDVRNINIESAATTICKIIYSNICNYVSGENKVTVNVYSRSSDNNIEYTTMVAHEGHISQPKAFGDRRMLKKSKNNRFSEKLFLNDSPDYKILLTKSAVAKAFNITEETCKYSQYLAVPIRKKGGKIIAIIEIVAHNEAKIWDDEDEARLFAARFCEVFKEYMLLISRLYDQNVTIASKIDKEAC